MPAGHCVGSVMWVCKRKLYILGTKLEVTYHAVCSTAVFDSPPSSVQCTKEKWDDIWWPYPKPMVYNVKKDLCTANVFIFHVVL